MRAPTEQTYKQRILRVLVHIQAHLDDPLALEDLAAVAHFSPYHFHRVFHGMVGESVQEHVRRLRLERAAQRLKSGDLPVVQVALEAGYEAHESFTRAFRAQFGVAPSRFRAAHRAAAAAAPSGVHYVDDGQALVFQPFHSGGRSMDVRIESVPVMRVAFLRHLGPYRQVGQTWGRLMSWAGPRGLLGPSARFLGIAHDDPAVTPPDKLRYDACIVVDPHFRPEGDVGVEEVGGGAYAVTTHRGPYERLTETYARLCGEWLPAHGREPRHAPSFTIHRNFPDTTAPEDLLTDIYMPVTGRA